jgi:divalent metal cation (Fe/Co/Zn/Cd) transporter
MSPWTQHRFGSTTLPDEQRAILRRAKRLELVSLAFLVSAVVVVYLVMGSSQAMKVAWIEDLLSLIPPVAFLVAVHRARREPSVSHPYGHHRAVGAAHLAAAVALLAMGTFLIVDSGSGLLSGEHPPIGSVNILGQTIWAGWLMVAAMVYTGIGPVILGRLKMPLAEGLHDKVLMADADMNKADWMTAGAAILGVLGIGAGLWWADGVAAMVISLSILKDGWEQVSGATRDLLDGEARTFDDAEVHPLVDDLLGLTRDLPWVSLSGCRVRDEGHVFHAEVFVVPVGEATLDQCEGLADAVRMLDWKFDDVVVAPVSELPPGIRTRPRGLEPEE